VSASETQRGIQSYFDDSAAQYAAQYEQHTQAGYALHSRMRRVLELFDQPGRRVLDAGCGPGVMAGTLAAAGCDVTGMDIAYRMSALAQQRYPKARFGVSDVKLLPFADQHFDAVLAMGVLEYALDERAALRELTRVLRPGGTLIVSFPNAHSPYARWRGLVYYRAIGYARPLINFVKRRPAAALSASLHRGYSEERVRAWLVETGCPVEQIAYYNFQVLLSPLDAWLAPLSVPLAYALDHHARGRWRWLGGGMVVRARRGE
jgi:ubiquinone/menaquinone biosynthesis C-methylase UbiE